MKTVSQKTKIVLDIVLTVLLVFEMLIQYTGNFLHEVMGFVFFATIAMHVLLSSAWLKSTAQAISKHKLSQRRRAKVMMNSALAITMIVLVASSLAISDILYQAGLSMPGAYDVWSALHTASSYLLCVLVVAHLGIHWATIASSLKVPYSPARRQAIGGGVQVAAAFGMLMLGVKGAEALVLDQTDSADSTDPIEQAASDTLTDQQQSVPDATLNDTPYSNYNNQNYEASNGHGRHGRKHMDQQTTEQYGANQELGTQDSAGQGQSPQDSTGTSDMLSIPDEQMPQQDVPMQNGSADQSSGSDGWSWGESGSSNTADICTLCRKYCSLSAPRCDKPYAAGLI